jgi:hypothetical protein
MTVALQQYDRHSLTPQLLLSNTMLSLFLSLSFLLSPLHYLLLIFTKNVLPRFGGRVVGNSEQIRFVVGTSEQGTGSCAGHTVLTLLSHCCYAAVALLLHCCYTVVTLLLHCRYTVVTLLLQFCWTLTYNRNSLIHTRSCSWLWRT